MATHYLFLLLAVCLIMLLNLYVNVVLGYMSHLTVNSVGGTFMITLSLFASRLPDLMGLICDRE